MAGRYHPYGRSACPPRRRPTERRSGGGPFQVYVPVVPRGKDLTPCHRVRPHQALRGPAVSCPAPSSAAGSISHRSSGSPQPPLAVPEHRPAPVLPGARIPTPGCDYWQLLGLPPGSCAESVRARYRALATAAHPDSCRRGTPAERRAAYELFCTLGEAYQVLTTPALRGVYEEGGLAGLSSISGGQGIPFDPSEVFSSVFGGQGGLPSAAAPPRAVPIPIVRTMLPRWVIAEGYDFVVQWLQHQDPRARTPRRWFVTEAPVKQYGARKREDPKVVVQRANAQLQRRAAEKKAAELLALKRELKELLYQKKVAEMTRELQALKRQLAAAEERARRRSENAGSARGSRLSYACGSRDDPGRYRLAGCKRGRDDPLTTDQSATGEQAAELRPPRDAVRTTPPEMDHDRKFSPSGAHRAQSLQRLGAQHLCPPGTWKTKRARVCSASRDPRVPKSEKCDDGVFFSP
eukprot:TRINITY_DN17490_c0_g1_i2.p1 TRINITY_DN17490_c0_g1~~TRINITY_DN17490_c0_g1_i2.p1  ORF type:complete len:483 (+),score=25.18 TRINITY_DN17490_c0_g1_i2:61-1449(+)